MSTDTLKRRLESQLSRETCKQLLIDLVRVPSPQTTLLEAEPQLRRFIEDAIAPRLRALGATCRFDAMGNLIAHLGAGTSGRSLMLIGHAMNHPPGGMPDPYDG
ncbi:MAG TPA: hypothetical protein VG270_15045, partial [Pseudolabrys sp.]|nr:hypothetical protein [Pseudolabrys sp.]